ncbi:hypothetical protein [Siminovitchia terrae]|uniref:hypothetical protein n=1 Tax=Siminovitchia terrae TaxID=1914933 RepID=UPI001BB34910|nr:hypothetical protein [Siminovitchia terrae]
MTYFQVGSLAIPAVWVAASGALFVAALFNRAFMGKKVEDWYWNGFFYYFVLWKLSYIVFNLGLFLDMPLSVLYFNGGTKGHIFALAILSVYLLVFALKRFPFLYEESAWLFLLYFTSYQVIIGFWDKSSLELFIHLILLGILLILLSQKNKKSLTSRQIFPLFILLELLIISWFDSLFSLESLTIIWMGLIVFILTIKADKGAR